MAAVARFMVLAAGTVMIVLLAAGYAGAVHPIGDSLAVFRAQGAAGLGVLAALAWLMRLRRAALAGGLLAILTGGPLVWAYQVAGKAGDLVLYQKNMLFMNDDIAGLGAGIREADPDVVTLQEVSQPNLALLAALSDRWPHQHFCPFAGVGGVAVLSRLPPAGQTVCAKGLAAMLVQGPEGPFWVVSVHLHWPWPYGQAGQVRELIPVLEGLEGSVIMAGDFNMVPWSDAMARLRAASRTRHAGPVRGTLPRFGPLVVLPIDHVLAPAGGFVELRPQSGSDHRGLVARLGVAG